MSDLRRFPVSDEFISYRKTLDSVCDRIKFLEFFQFAFLENGNFLGKVWKCRE